MRYDFYIKEKGKLLKYAITFDTADKNLIHKVLNALNRYYIVLTHYPNGTICKSEYNIDKR